MNFSFLDTFVSLLPTAYTIPTLWDDKLFWKLLNKQERHNDLSRQFKLFGMIISNTEYDIRIMITIGRFKGQHAEYSFKENNVKKEEIPTLSKGKLVRG